MSMDAMGMSMIGVRAAQVEAESSRPWAPVVPDRHDAARERAAAAPHPVRAVRPRRALAGALHRVADAVAPREGVAHLGHPAR
ncbi:hypothetical protein [Cellulomonas oligotrophica]|uniref:Uncharacterized protein n=1 Tax=Cellulomonas oligotrophica TaxID=931536 RepID=A0A7Y9JZD3_9CELL|nr:hypothetical protein [Cellulomonas oligotrophica]NYD87816.1 hypothetical protein [Cellulomonas oligotrophica]GIG32979.1 hypothetical protein Col01nite_21380 [Cellulomonas oligotrophica]